MQSASSTNGIFLNAFLVAFLRKDDGNWVNQRNHQINAILERSEQSEASDTFIRVK